MDNDNTEMAKMVFEKSQPILEFINRTQFVVPQNETQKKFMDRLVWSGIMLGKSQLSILWVTHVAMSFPDLDGMLRDCPSQRDWAGFIRQAYESCGNKF